MKSLRTILIVLGAMVLVLAPMLIVDSYQAHKSQQEHERATFVKSVVRQKVEAYEKANGRYPDSLNDLTFTNSAQEHEIAPDLSNISYFRRPSGYVIGWDGTYVHN